MTDTTCMTGSPDSGMRFEGVKLPPPRTSGGPGVAECIARRRSVREYAEGELTLEDLSQLLWAAQGVTGPEGRRAAPSARALYPVETLVVVGRVTGLPMGVYRYVPGAHELTFMMVEVLKAETATDLRPALARAALDQESVAKAAASLVFAAVYARVTGTYGDRGVQYVHMEVGHIVENVYLQAEALGLGTVVMGAFHDEQVQRLLGLERDERPLAIMPVGRVL